jgi:hypothetical protein
VILWCAALIVTANPAAAVSSSPAWPSAPTPFDRPDVFCTKSPVLPGVRNSSSPGVTPSSLTFADGSVDTAQLRKLGLNLIDFHQVMQVLINEVNKCGGVNGRKVILKSALYNPLAPDLVGHVQALCLKITEDYKALVEISNGAPPAGVRCVSVDHKTISLAQAYSSAAEFTGSKGRVVSFYPAGDRIAAAYIADGAAQHAFDNHKVAVLAVAFPNAGSVREQQEQYVDGLAAKGVNAEFDVLPCSGTQCMANVGSAIRRMKQNGIDLIVLSHYMPASNVGQIFREMSIQGLRAAVSGPEYAGIHDDSVMAGFLAAAGTEGASWMNQVGWTAVSANYRGAWRTGEAKDTAISRTCQNLVAKALNQPPYQHNATDIVSGSWTAVASMCISVRAFMRAIYTLGNDVTTDRLVAALREEPASDRRESIPLRRTKELFSGSDVTPTYVTSMKIVYPCPLMQSNPNPCPLPIDRPVSYRAVPR